MLELIKAANALNFTVIELKQEKDNGSPGVVEYNTNGAIGSVFIRMVSLVPVVVVKEKD
jgi:hypothetical protein